MPDGSGWHKLLIVNQSPISVALLAYVLIAPAFALQQVPGVDALKRTLEKELMDLKPTGFTERNVLFQEVTAGRPTAGSYPFRVTALIRDYGSGYPKNRYYGQTCVGKMTQRDFLMVPDAFGGWQVQGAMTVSLGPDSTCTNNPSEGASSFPLSTLTGTRVPAGSDAASVPAGAATVGGGKGVALGTYECWANGRARGMMNFKITGPGRYTDSEAKAGGFRLDEASGRMSFQGGLLDGVLPAKFYMIYYAPKGHPTLSIRNGEGSEITFCERVP